MMPDCVSVGFVEACQLVVQPKRSLTMRFLCSLAKRAVVCSAVLLDVDDGLPKRRLHELPLLLVEHGDDHVAAPTVLLFGH